MARILSPKIKEIKKGLYLVSTPIGNLQDITLRAINILQNSDFILCEDTRISKILLKKFDIKSKLISNHKFNEKKNLAKVIGLLENGSIISLISDAGTPTVSDPGSILVNECVNRNINIFPIPGPSSVTTAMSLSGFSEKFLFYGFWPDKKNILTEDLKKLSLLNCSIVIFISSKKINKAIPDLKKNFKGRKILICREMTKFYEEFIRSNIDDLEQLNINLKGELTIVISENKFKKIDSQNLSESDKQLIRNMIKKLSVKEIIEVVNRDKKIQKKEIYNFCISIKNEN